MVDAHLGRIEQTDGKLNSFITVLGDEALAAARQSEQMIMRGQYLGPLHGIPIGLKDLFDTKGVRTTSGSRILQNHVPQNDATSTQRLKEAGAIIIGKLNLDEFALGAASLNPHFGPTHNPWDLERVTGGSSGGSGSAVAAGQCMAALGTDTGGSIRIPASFCGIVGLKPTFGLVSRHGVYPVSWTVDTVGPMTRTVEDAALIMNAVSGHDPHDLCSSSRTIEDYTVELGTSVQGVRVGLVKEAISAVIDPEVKEATVGAAEKLDRLGASVDELSIPWFFDARDALAIIVTVEETAVHQDNLRHRAEDIGTELRAGLELGVFVPGISYVNAHRARTVYAREFGKLWARFDVLLAPTQYIAAPRIDDASANREEGFVPAHAPSDLPTAPFNMLGVPAITVPCGFTARGLPIGLQIVGKAFDDVTVLRVAHAYEQATDWHARRPPA